MACVERERFNINKNGSKASMDEREHLGRLSFFIVWRREKSDGRVLPTNNQTEGNYKFGSDYIFLIIKRIITENAIYN